MENKTISAEPLLLLIWKNRIKFIIVAVTTIIVSSIASFLIPVKFKSVASLLPSKSASLPMGERTLPPHGVELFGNDGEGEQMMAILNSGYIKYKLIEKFKLFKHYSIDEKSSTKNDAMANNLKEHIKFEKTRWGNIDIVVWDRNPDTAALIANAITDYFDEAMGNMIAESATKNKILMEAQYKKILAELKRLEDTISALSTLGVVGDREEYAALEERQTIAMEKGGKFAEIVNEQMANNNKYRAAYLNFFNRHGYLVKRADIISANIAQFETDASPGMSYKFPVEHAAPADKKAYPIRWLVVVVSTIASLFFLLTLLVVLHKIKDLKSMS